MNYMTTSCIAWTHTHTPRQATAHAATKTCPMWNFWRRRLVNNHVLPALVTRAWSRSRAAQRRFLLEEAAPHKDGMGWTFCITVLSLCPSSPAAAAAALLKPWQPCCHSYTTIATRSPSWGASKMPTRFHLWLCEREKAQLLLLLTCGQQWVERFWAVHRSRPRLECIWVETKRASCLQRLSIYSKRDIWNKKWTSKTAFLFLLYLERRPSSAWSS